MKKKEISKAAASCYPTIIMYKRRLIRSQDDTWVHKATDRKDSAKNRVEVIKLEGLVNAINWNQRWAQTLFLFTSPWSQWDGMFCSPECLLWGPCLHAVPATAWILRGYPQRGEQEKSCSLPGAEQEWSFSSSQSRPGALNSRALLSSRWGISIPHLGCKRFFFLLLTFIAETTLILTAHAPCKGEFSLSPSCCCNLFSTFVLAHPLWQFP